MAGKEDLRIGNEYWRLRADLSVDGKKLSIAEVTQKLQEYIERCATQKIKVADWVGKDAEKIHREKMITMSIWGACAYLGITDDTWSNWRKDKRYLGVLTRAETIFKSYNIEGAGAGELNQSIIARLEGLKDHKEVSGEGLKVSVTKEETKKIGQDLENEY